MNVYLAIMKKQMLSVLFLLGLLFSAFIPFSNLISNSVAAEVILLWDANDEGDLAGYAVYQSSDTPGPPYDLIDDISLAELSNPDNPEVIVTQLEDGKKYHFVVTAYDKANNESNLSNEICLKIEGSSIADCASATSSGGGGGGGG